MIFKQSIFVTSFLLVFSTGIYAHGVDSNTAHFLTTTEGAAIVPFLYTPRG